MTEVLKHFGVRGPHVGKKWFDILKQKCKLPCNVFLHYMKVIFFLIIINKIFTIVDIHS